MSYVQSFEYVLLVVALFLCAFMVHSQEDELYTLGHIYTIDRPISIEDYSNSDNFWSYYVFPGMFISFYMITTIPTHPLINLTPSHNPHDFSRFILPRCCKTRYH